MKKSPLRHRMAWAGAAALFSALPLSASACSTEPTVGEICMVVMNWCPQGYVPANGALLPIGQYNALYSLVSTTYGGDGRTTFGVPDLRGRTPIGTNANASLPNVPVVALGQKIGNTQTTLQVTQMPVHNHAAAFTTTMVDTPVTIPGQTGSLAGTASLPVSTSTTGALSGNTVALGNGQTGYLTGVKGVVNGDPITFTGPYTTTAPGVGAASLAGTVTLTGSPTIPPSNVTLKLPTGGTVVVATNGGSAPVSIQSPAQGVTYCIGANGYYPNRPD